MPNQTENRTATLLQACRDLLNIQRHNQRDLNILEQVVPYNGTYVNGETILNEIDVELTHPDKRHEIQRQLFERVKRFMKENRVTCDEDVHQSDHIIENAYVFIGDLFNIIEPVLSQKTEGDE